MNALSCHTSSPVTNAELDTEMSLITTHLASLSHPWRPLLFARFAGPIDRLEALPSPSVQLRVFRVHLPSHRVACFQPAGDRQECSRAGGRPPARRSALPREIAISWLHATPPAPPSLRRVAVAAPMRAN